MKRFLWAIAVVTMYATAAAQPSADSTSSKANRKSLTARPVQVTPVSVSMSKGEKPGFKLMIPEVQPADIEKDLEKAIRNKTKSKFTKDGDEIGLLATIVSEISEAPIDVYARITAEQTDTQVIFFVEADSSFVSNESNAELADRVVRFLHDFGVSSYKQVTDDHLKAEQKTLSKLENDLKKLKKRNDNLHKSINDNDLTISNAELDLKSNARQQEQMEEEIIKQRAVVAGSTDKVVEKEEKKKLNGFEKEKDKLRREAETLTKRIERSKREIDEAKAEIQTNLSDQSATSAAIDDQRTYVSGVEHKLAEIN